MPVASGVTIKGLDKIQKKLKQLGPKLEKKALLSAANTGAEVIRKQAEQNVSWTRRLKKFIIKRRVKSPRGSVKIQIGASTDGFFGHFLELGTRVRKTAKGAGRGQVSPRPWLRPAFDNTKGKAVKVFGEKIWKKVKELAAKR